MAEKTEQPTEKKLRDSAKKGQTFKSKDLTAAIVLFCGITFIGYGLSLFSFSEFIKNILQHPGAVDIKHYITMLMRFYFILVLPVIGICLFSGALFALFQSKFQLATEAIKLDINNLNPVSGFKKIFSMRSVKEIVKALLYLVVFCVAIYVFYILYKREVFMIYRSNINTLINEFISMGVAFVFIFLATSLLVLIFDALVEYFLHIKDQKMEKHEVKKEYKESEGNPEIKSARKQAHFELLSEQTKSNIASSEFVVANPTHIAIAIYFNPDVIELPFISVRATNTQALAVIAYAEEIGIPVVRDVRIARNIYFSHQLYSFVRDDALIDVMKILLWLKQVEFSGGDPRKERLFSHPGSTLKHSVTDSPEANNNPHE